MHQCEEGKGIKMRFLVLDPSKTGTGWAYFDSSLPKHLVASGCIRPHKKDGHWMSSIEKQLKVVLAEYSPEKAWMENKYKYARKYYSKKLGRWVITVGGSQEYASAWNLVNKVISDHGIPCEELDTRRLVKNKMAVLCARRYTDKKVGEDEAECICWGEFLIANKFNQGQPLKGG